MMFAFCLMAAAGLAYYLFCVLENKRRDSTYGPSRDTVAEGIESDRQDKTDMENTNFRYTY